MSPSAVLKIFYSQIYPAQLQKVKKGEEQKKKPVCDITEGVSRIGARCEGAAAVE